MRPYREPVAKRAAPKAGDLRVTLCPESNCPYDLERFIQATKFSWRTFSRKSASYWESIGRYFTEAEAIAGLRREKERQALFLVDRAVWNEGDPLPDEDE